MINSKHLATFLMGAAAGAAIMKYNNMTKEAQDELLNDLKSKAAAAQDEANVALTQMHEYFTDLQGKGMEMLKTNMGAAEGVVNEFLAKVNAPLTQDTKKA